MHNKINHLAVIMDGNRRWARKNSLDILLGHSKGGIDAARLTIQFCLEQSISYLSLYTFSLENFKRSVVEKNCLFNLITNVSQADKDSFIKNGIAIKFVGDRSLFPDLIKASCNDLENITKDGKNLSVQILFCYGGRQEIMAAAKLLSEKINKGDLPETAWHDEKEFKKCLWSGDIPDPDLIIRTGGAKRLSNFLLFQSAYSELYFLDCFWPEVTYEKLMQAICWFDEVKRNFGV